MVRNYERKKPKPSYTEADLKEAVKAVKMKAMGLLRASTKYKIPRSTIRDHVTGSRGIKSETCGRPTALPKDVEAKLAECLKCLEKWGFGLSRKEILEIVGSYVKLNKIKNVPFKNGKPGEDSVTEPTFIWPSVDDISVVPRDSVILILPEPDVRRRGDMKFNVGFTFSSYRLD